MLRFFFVLSVFAALAPPAAQAQQFTTAAEVRPILEAQKTRWAALRDWEGNDLVYFTPILSWRCGLSAIHYGINGGPANIAYEMEPCYEDRPAPNALLESQTYPIYITLPGGFVRSVTVMLTYDDGTTSSSTMEAASIVTP